MQESEARLRRLAATQSAYRSANERMQRQALSHHFAPGQGVPFVCECSDPNCHEIVMLSLEDYDRLRAHPSRFLLSAGHEDAEATHERIVEAEDGYAIVENTGMAGEEATRLDPRTQDERPR